MTEVSETLSEATNEAGKTVVAFLNSVLKALEEGVNSGLELVGILHLEGVLGNLHVDVKCILSIAESNVEEVLKVLLVEGLVNDTSGVGAHDGGTSSGGSALTVGAEVVHAVVE